MLVVAGRRELNDLAARVDLRQVLRIQTITRGGKLRAVLQFGFLKRHLDKPVAPHANNRAIPSVQTGIRG